MKILSMPKTVDNSGYILRNGNIISPYYIAGDMSYTSAPSAVRFQPANASQRGKFLPPTPVGTFTKLVIILQKNVSGVLYIEVNHDGLTWSNSISSTNIETVTFNITSATSINEISIGGIYSAGLNIDVFDIYFE